MVTLGRVLKFIFFFCPFFLSSAEFTATINQTQINVGNSLTLTLLLKGSSPKGNPDIDPLKKSFVIQSQQQTQHTTVINGQATSGITWKLVLIPKSEGEIEVPSITIQTSKGILSTKPIMIRAVKGEKENASHFQGGLILTSSVSEGNLYKNGTFVYTIQLTSKNDLANLKIENMEVKDAIVESDDKPKIYEKIIDGIQVGVIEYRYYITPLKDGTLTLPSNIIQGGILVKRKTAGSFFDDDFDPFSMMQGFGRIEPFALATEEVTVPIQPSVADVDPWLPAKSLKIEEIWSESQNLQVGEPFSRGFKISADGIHSSQLPSLSDWQSSSGLKIYADKPELGNDFQDFTIHSYRNEQYTIIPQQSGSIVLPKIEIVWWNTAEKKKMVAYIPERRLEVLPSSTQMMPKTQLPSSDQEANPNPPSEPSKMENGSLNYPLIGGLAFLLILSIVWTILLYRKIGKLKVGYVHVNQEGTSTKQTESPSKKKSAQKKEKREKLIDLNPT